jgi:hypothetical protein
MQNAEPDTILEVEQLNRGSPRQQRKKIGNPFSFVIFVLLFRRFGGRDFNAETQGHGAAQAATE